MNKRAAARCAVFAAAVLAAGVLGGCGGGGDGRVAWAPVSSKLYVPIDDVLSAFIPPPPNRLALDAIGRVIPDAWGDRGCTAFLVDRDKIMTAAHCVSKAGWIWYQANDFEFRARGASGVKARGLRYLHIGDYKNYQGRGSVKSEFLETVSNDTALIQLEKPVGDKLGWLPRGRVDWDEITSGGEYRIAGFPKGEWTVADGCRWHVGEKNWKKPESGAPANFPGAFAHTCDLEGGSSGSPVMRKEGGVWTWIGVHVADYTSLRSRVVNYAALLPSGPPPDLWSGAAVPAMPPRADMRDEFKAAGEIWTVKAAGGGDFETISAAIEAAAPGDGILVRSGVYRESLSIEKELYIESAEKSRNDVVIEAENNPCVYFAAERGAVRGMTLRNSGRQAHACVHIASGELLLADNDISSEVGDGVRVKWRNTGPAVIGNRIYKNQFFGVYVENNAKGRFADNDISENGLTGVYLRTAADPVFTGNRIYGNKKRGVYARAAAKGRFENNIIHSNALSGVITVFGADPLFINNSIFSNRRSGVTVSTDGKGRFEDNEISDSAVWGVVVDAGGAAVFERNYFADNGKAAFSIRAGARVTVSGNDFSGNKGGAWDIEDGADVVRSAGAPGGS